MAKFLLIHGAWHGGWCWDRIEERLAAEGHSVEVTTLPGHGGDMPSHTATLEMYRDHVVSLLDAQPEPVVLVGHSMGGLVISEAAEARPDKVRSLVYVTAFLCADGKSLLDYAGQEPISYFVTQFDARPEEGWVAINPDGIVPSLYHRCDPADAEAAAAKLVERQAFAPLATPVALTEARFGAVPKFYVECLDDQAIDIAHQKTLQAEWPVRKVFTIDTDHSPFISTPDELTAILHEVGDA